MSEEEKQIMNKMIYCNLVSGEQALKFNWHIKEILQENEQLKSQLQQKENIIKEVRESAKRELKIAEENIKNSEQWLEVEEEQEHAKRDIHTGKVVKRYMEMFLEILDKENKQ